MERLGYAVIGCGRVSKRHMAVASTMPGARLAAVVDANLDKAKQVANGFDPAPAAYTHFQDALKDKSVDLVVVCVPTHLHAEVVVAAAQAGKHIYCEKAMAASVGQCKAMMAAAHDNRVKLTIGQSTRFRRPVLMARRVIDSGAIGEPFAVTAQFPSEAEPASRGATDSWRYRAGSAGNGHVINFGCHYVDTARFLIGQDPTSVSAYIGNLFSRDMISEDQFAITAACDRGGIISISLHSSFGATSAQTDGYTVRGAEGCIVIPGPSSREITVTRGKESEVKGIDADLADEDAFARLHRLFRNAIETDGDVPLSGEVAMLNLEWGLAAYLSSEQRAWVDLPLAPEHADFMGPVVAETIPATRT